MSKKEEKKRRRREIKKKKKNEERKIGTLVLPFNAWYFERKYVLDFSRQTFPRGSEEGEKYYVTRTGSAPNLVKSGKMKFKRR